MRNILLTSAGKTSQSSIPSCTLCTLRAVKRKATTMAQTGGHIAPAAMIKGGVMWIGAISW